MKTNWGKFEIERQTSSLYTSLRIIFIENISFVISCLHYKLPFGGMKFLKSFAH